MTLIVSETMLDISTVSGNIAASKINLLRRVLYASGETIRSLSAQITPRLLKRINLIFR
jgi:hypothetical protein